MTTSKRRTRPGATVDDLAGSLLACCLLVGVALLTAGLVVTGAGLDHGLPVIAAGLSLTVLAAGGWTWSQRRRS